MENHISGRRCVLHPIFLHPGYLVPIDSSPVGPPAALQYRQKRYMRQIFRLGTNHSIVLPDAIRHP